MKVSIIGGAGRVGADAAYALQLSAVVREIAIVDVDQNMAAGEALDLLHGSSLVGNQRFSSGSYEQVCDSDCIVITAGLRRKPDESRLDLINRNVSLFKQILENVAQCKLKPTTTMVVVSNPVDILTTLAAKAGILPESKVIGLGTVLDTARFRSLLAERLGLGAEDIKALILGEHGDTMVPIWSSATIGGIMLSSVPGWSDQLGNEVFERTKKSGAEVISKKGGAGRAVGVSIRDVVEAIELDSRKLLPVSVMPLGANPYGQETAMSLPTVVGAEGAVGIVVPKLSQTEHDAMVKSAQALNDVWRQLQAS